MYNSFSCFAVHSKMAQSTSAKSKPLEGLYTDTDPGLVKVLCDNKAPRIKRQVASIDKKSDFRAKSGPFITSTSHMGQCQRRSLQKRSMFQVQECIVSRMPKYTEERGSLGQVLVARSMSVTVSSTAQRSHLQQLERS